MSSNLTPTKEKEKHIFCLLKFLISQRLRWRHVQYVRRKIPVRDWSIIILYSYSLDEISLSSGEVKLYAADKNVKSMIPTTGVEANCALFIALLVHNLALLN